MKTIISVTACAFLSACGGSSGSKTMEPPDMTRLLNKPKLEVVQADLRDFAVIDTAPTGAGASFDGYVSLLRRGDDLPGFNGEVIGVASLDVTFDGAGSMSGTIDDFDDTFGGTYTGELLVTNGALGAGPRGAAISGDMNGTLVRNSGQSFTVAGGVTGEFVGDGGQGLRGLDSATVSSAGETITIDVALSAERQ